MQRKDSKNNSRLLGAISRFASKALVLPIKLYQKLLSPLLGRHCRFVPSCSEYAIEAIKSLGPIRGSVKAIIRLLRCNPFCKGGYDPVHGRQH
jgi:putative membrane protein insertion efficiency factor